MTKAGTPKRDLLSYVAGIIDGEGCIGVHKERKYQSGTTKYRMRVIVGNCDKRLVVFLRNNFGGSISNRNTRGNRQVAYAWELSANQAKRFLDMILPYLFLKKDQAKAAIEFQGNGLPMRKATPEEASKRSLLILKLRRLNQVGKIKETQYA